MAQIGDILAKLGSGEALNQDEQQRIRLWGNNTEFNNAYIAGLQNGSSDLSVKTINAEFGNFSVSPVRGLVLSGGINLSVTINTWTYIDFSIIQNTTNASAFSVASDNTRLLIRNGAVSIGSTYIMVGRANWSAFNTAIIRLFQYDSSDALLPQATNLGWYNADEQPFCGALTIQPTCAYMKIGVYQTTSSPATLSSMEVSFFEVV